MAYRSIGEGKPLEDNVKDLIFYIALALLIGYLLWLLKRWQKKHLSSEESSRDVAERLFSGDSLACGTCASCQCGAEFDGCTTRKKEETDYYDDEELDALKGKAPESYTQEDKDLVRDVIDTLLSSDLQGWKESVEKRGITLPEELWQLWQSRKSQCL